MAKRSRSEGAVIGVRFAKSLADMPELSGSMWSVSAPALTRTGAMTGQLPNSSSEERLLLDEIQLQGVG